MKHSYQECDGAIELLIQAETGIHPKGTRLSLKSQAQNVTLYNLIYTTFLK